MVVELEYHCIIMEVVLCNYRQSQPLTPCPNMLSSLRTQDLKCHEGNSHHLDNQVTNHTALIVVLDGGGVWGTPPFLDIRPCLTSYSSSALNRHVGDALSRPAVSGQVVQLSSG